MAERWRSLVVWRPLRSVRVRITLAATVVTAVAVMTAGWLLLQAVEGTQRGELADRTEDRLDEVAAALERGTSPREAVESTTTDIFVEVFDEDGCPVAVGPRISLGTGRAVLLRIDAATATGTFEQARLPAQPEPASQEPDPGEAGSPAPEGTPCPDGVSVVARGADTRADAAGGGAAGGEGTAPDTTVWPERVDRVAESDDVLGTRTDVPLELLTQTVGTDQGELTVRAAAPVDEVERSVAAVRRALWWGLPALVVLVAGVAWGLVGRALRPVEAIRSEVEAIGGATMHRRVPEPPASDEIGRLARTMNAMLGRLEAAACRQRQFVSDASHELRSPVAAIRTDIEVALLEGAGADWRSVAGAVLGEETRLERLLDDLLVLAAVDETGSPRAAAPVDLAALVAAEAERARRAPVRVRVVTPWGDPSDGPVTTTGDAGQLRRVVANLLDNAARHARATVEATVTTAGAAVRLAVDDDGAGIAPADRERVFERFTRLDEGRTRDRGGAGLGLAVVRSLVAQHGGRVWAEEAPGGGARFVVELPRQPELGADLARNGPHPPQVR